MVVMASFYGWQKLVVGWSPRGYYSWLSAIRMCAVYRHCCCQASLVSQQLSATRDELSSSQMLSGQQALTLHQQEQHIAGLAECNTQLEQQLQESTQQVMHSCCGLE